MACNKVGCSDRHHIQLKTKGSTPQPPDKESLLATINSTFVIINLSAFSDNGCPLQHFQLKYRPKETTVWTLYSNFIHSSQKSLLIDGLSSNSWYYIQITAYSQAGSSQAEYNFLTRTTHNCKSVSLFKSLSLSLTRIHPLLSVCFVSETRVFRVVSNKSQTHYPFLLHLLCLNPFPISRFCESYSLSLSLSLSLSPSLSLTHSLVNISFKFWVHILCIALYANYKRFFPSHSPPMFAKTNKKHKFNELSLQWII